MEDETVQKLQADGFNLPEGLERDHWEFINFEFTYVGRYSQQQQIEHLLSLGLPYVQRLFESTGDQGRELFLHHPRHKGAHRGPRFLTEALYFLGPSGLLPKVCVYPNLTRSCSEESSEDISQGWYWSLRRGNFHRASDLLFCDYTKGLRDWGYVFWDYVRLRESGILSRE